MLVDIASDIFQSLRYYEHSFNKYGEYANWSMSINATDEHRETVSPVYFYIACVVWILPPLLFEMYVLIADNQPLVVTRAIIMNKYVDDGSCSMCTCVCIVSLLPIDTLASVIFVYFMIPYASLKSGVKALIGKPYGDDDIIFRGIKQNLVFKLPWLKLFEQTGEALPQFVMSLTFLVNNYAFLQHNVTMFGVNEFHVTIITVVLSLGSLLYGIYKGGVTCYNLHFITL